ncbi:MAG: hypothetical protein NTY31_00555 [Candidatus Falkowbacteria bacterium]|nr:hypothetical protein [Candidatus Falkowbacteria bacterium]
MSKKGLIIQELFYFFTALLGVFIILEIIWPNIILAYFNLNYLIILWFIVGLIALTKNSPPIRK